MGEEIRRPPHDEEIAAADVPPVVPDQEEPKTSVNTVVGQVASAEALAGRRVDFTVPPRPKEQ
jgi:hypothetical protein